VAESFFDQSLPKREMETSSEVPSLILSVNNRKKSRNAARVPGRKKGGKQ